MADFDFHIKCSTGNFRISHKDALELQEQEDLYS